MTELEPVVEELDTTEESKKTGCIGLPQEISKQLDDLTPSHILQGLLDAHLTSGRQV